MAKVKSALIAFLTLPLVLLAGCSGGTTAAQKTAVRVAPYTNAQGQSQQMVYVDWKNTGTTPIRYVVADLSFYNASGTQVGGFGKCVLYSVSGSEPGIAAGTTYMEPPGQGYAIDLPGSPAVASAQADIKTVAEAAP